MPPSRHHADKSTILDLDRAQVVFPSENLEVSEKVAKFAGE